LTLGIWAELKRRNVIRIALFYVASAWLILQVADVVLEILEAPEGSLRLLAIVLALGFPFALILAWAFEVTPEGIKRDHDVVRDDAAQARAGRKLDVATIGLLAVAIAMLAWQGFSGRLGSERAPGSGPRELSIAVLPFVNMSVELENEYFSEGLSEEVLNVLARMEDFRVAGRTSSFAFKGQQQDLRAIGERLGVANILEGSVRRQGDRIRVTAQLVDARSGYHLWSDTYDRQLDDVFAIQDEIATEVVRALRRTLLAADEAIISQTAKGDLEAYQHYLQGQFHARLRSRAGLERALEEFHQAIVVDPAYAPPYAGIAMVYALMDNHGYRSLAETAPLAYRALDRALELDAQSDDAWMVRGLLLSQGPGARERRDEARAALRRAIEINPNNPLAHLWIANLLHPDAEAARASVERAYQLDPLSPIILYRRAMEALERREFDEFARRQAELEEIAPDWFITWQSSARAALEEGRIADATLALERALELNPEYATISQMLVNALILLGYEERAEGMLVAAVQRYDSDAARFGLLMQQARRSVVEEGLPTGLQIFRAGIEALPRPDASMLGDLAMLELNAGNPAAAEARARDALRLGPDELPPEIMPQHTVVSLALLGALAAQGKAESAQLLGDQIQAALDDLRRQGLVFNHVPLAEAYVAAVLGNSSDAALDRSMEEAIALGLRWPPGIATWFLSGNVKPAVIARFEARMAGLLAVEQQRYEAARAARPPRTDGG
jgi:TolB-like protein/Tfp pilus assembly protein PilF